MPVAKISKRTVDEMPLPPDARSRTYIWDDRLKGFAVMATATGAKSYLVQYRIGGRDGSPRRVTIGRHGSPWTPDAARERAADILAEVRKKIDPFDAERARVAAERETKRQVREAKIASERLGFDVYADSFVKNYAAVRQKPRVAQETRGIVERDLKPFFKGRLITSITPRDALALIENVQVRSNSAALKAYRTLSTLFAWAASRHDVPDNPMRNLKPPYVQPSRDRVPAEVELKAIWAATEHDLYPYGALVRLLLMTGQRLREVSDMTWDEVDIDARIWTVPGSRTKNGKTNIVPLSDGAIEVLNALPRKWAEDAKRERQPEYVFSTTGKTPFSGFSKLKKRLDFNVHVELGKLVDAESPSGANTEVRPWRLHDLRRTVATGLQRLGVRLEVTEAVLNHVSGSRAGIVGIYQRHNWAEEKRAALVAWDHCLRQMLRPQP